MITNLRIVVKRARYVQKTFEMPGYLSLMYIINRRTEAYRTNMHRAAWWRMVLLSLPEFRATPPHPLRLSVSAYYTIGIV
jgi:hypothetical protein